MAAQLATAAGANFFMDVYLGSDRMLAHFVNSGHDDQTMREIYDRRPAPEYLTWAVKKGIFELSSDGNVKRGLRWGDPRQFISSESEFLRLCDSLPLAPGFENAGPRPVNSVQRILRVNQAVGREAVHSELKISELEEFGFRVLSTNASNRIEHLKNPEVGSQLCFESREKLSGENHDVQIVVTDGLSAEAVHHNIPNLLPIVQDGLKSRSYIMGQPILVPYGRVKLAEAIGDLLLPRLVILLIGERPGGDAFSSRSLSAYLAIRLSGTSAHDAAVRYSGNQRISYEYTVITNIYSGGIPAVEAGSVVAEKAMEILEYQAAGNRLETILNSL
jgi:ethanolamine ammonia-lyase large subunit